MPLKEPGIVHKRDGDTLVATVRFNLKERKDMHLILDGLTQTIPREYITGPAFAIFRFVSSVTEGFDVEAGFPVSQAVQADEITSWVLPGMEVLSLIHSGPVEELRESYGKLYGYTAEHGLVSDEFSREVYLDGDNPEGNEIEIQFVIHNWNRLLGEALERVLGAEARRTVMRGSDALTLESIVAERFRWVKGAMERLEGLADEHQRYDVVSCCAHVFPADQIEKLRAVYERARAVTEDPLKAVDAVIAFMGADPAWVKQPVREGHVIYSSKNPRDPKGYENAQDEAERKRAYCFCPLVRDHLDQGMPVTFCYCGAGWYRRQWEGAIGRPVRIEIVKSLLKGDDHCQFAIHLPDDL